MENVLGYQRNKEDLRGVILNLVAKNKQTIYGSQSTNKQLPIHLRKKANDFDILTKQPKKYAEELKDKLNKQYGKERFKVIEATHKGTFKVKDIETGENIADYTRTTNKPKSINELGVRYSNLKYQEGKVRKMLKDESSSFRHDKDFDTLKRIKERRKKW